MTPEITAYEILKANDRETCVKGVNDFIKKGWQPYGGLAVTPPSETEYEIYAQAMVRYEEPAK
jgi:hypothetical protein